MGGIILVTGGTGYIGSHVCIELIEAKHNVIVLDNYCNSHPQTIEKVREITQSNIKFYKMDLLDRSGLEEIFRDNDISAVIHLAGLKAVAESVSDPIRYYSNNITGTLALCEMMEKYHVKRMVFSSSATVYRTPQRVPISEDFPVGAASPYGRTKLMIEEILQDVYRSDPFWGISILRYFNPIGAHPSGLIGENPQGVPNNLMPYITQVASGIREKLKIYGNDYNTHDGTAIRDFIHVVDLAKGHVNALHKVMGSPGVTIYNLGTGIGLSVLDLVKSFEKGTNQKIPYVFTDRRPGDVEKSYADPSKANIELGWVAEKNIEAMCRDAWNWELNRLENCRKNGE